MKQRILVVEDDPAILTGLVDLLEEEGFAVLQATDGTEALASHAREKPDVILLDVMIPEKTATTCAGRSAARIRSPPSSCSRRRARRWTRWWGWSWAPTTTW